MMSPSEAHRHFPNHTRKLTVMWFHFMTVMSYSKAISKHDVNIGVLGDHIVLSSLIYVSWLQNVLHCPPDLSLFIRSVLSITEMHGGKTKLLCPIYPGFFYLYFVHLFLFPSVIGWEGGGEFILLVIWQRHIFFFCFLQPVYQNFFVNIKKPMEKKRLCDKSNLTKKCEQC